MYYSVLRQMKKQLHQLETWFDAANAHAEAKSFDPNLFLSLRLSPDQFAFARQVQVTCDTVKLMASRLTGKEAPKHADDEKTVEELRARVRGVIDYLDGFKEEDFRDAGGKVITQPRWNGKVMTGQDYFLEHGVPNFFFHLTTAYAILRHNGVSLGKKDYLGALTQTMG